MRSLDRESSGTVVIIERTAPLPLVFAPWIENPPATSDPNKALKTVHLYTDGSYRQTDEFQTEMGH
jgi:hypothetical protein